ncbi:MAG: hypothetical protein ABI726_02980 [bacterium]
MHRVICRTCGRDFEVDLIEEMELIESSPGARPAVAPDSPAPIVAAQTPAPAGTAGAPAQRRRSLLPRVPAVSLPGPLRDLSSPARRYGTIAVGALAVIAALMVIQGGGHGDDPAAATPAALEAGAAPKAGGKAEGSAAFVRESTFSLALPEGWERMDASGAATFAAAAAAGDADATLWVERDAKLDFPTFEARSLQQLRSLAGSAQVVERVAAPTAEATVVRLAADAPEGSPRYEVTLRSAGPYRYYLATTLQPGASKQAAAGVELVHGTFAPAGAEDSKAKGGKG